MSKNEELLVDPYVTRWKALGLNFSIEKLTSHNNGIHLIFCADKPLQQSLQWGVLNFKLSVFDLRISCLAFMGPYITFLIKKAAGEGEGDVQGVFLMHNSQRIEHLAKVSEGMLDEVKSKHFIIVDKDMFYEFIALAEPEIILLEPN
jgi:hypothetical protein